MAILDSFGTDRHRLNISMAAERTGMTRAAARRHLLTLEYLGYLESDGHYFYLTPKILKFSGSYLGGAQLPKMSQPLLNLLTNRTSLIFSVMVLDGYEAITIARSAAHQQTDRVNPYGFTFRKPFTCTCNLCRKDFISTFRMQSANRMVRKIPSATTD